MFYIFKYVPGTDWDCLPVAYLQQDFLKVDNVLLECALADSACPEDATFYENEKNNDGYHDGGVDVVDVVDVDMENILGSVNGDKGRDSLDEFEQYEH